MSDSALVGADYAWEPGTKITITLVSGQTLRGVIWFADEIAVALQEARLWDDAQWIEQGEVVAPYSAIAYINRVPYKHTSAHPHQPVHRSSKVSHDLASRSPESRSSDPAAHPTAHPTYKSPPTYKRR